MKKMTALFLSLCLLLGCCLGAASAEEAPRFKIGFFYGDFTSKLGEQFLNCLKYIADDLNIEVVPIEGGFGEASIAALESVAAAKSVDGIISASGASPAFLKALGTIPLVGIGSSFPSDPAEVKEVGTYENFLGAVIDSDYNAGYTAAKSMYEAGCRNLCLAGLTQGMSAAHDARVQGVKDFLAEHEDYKLLADDYSRAQYAPAISNFAAAFMEMDSLFTSSCNDAVFTTMLSEGLIGTVKLGTVDITESTGDYFGNGTLAYVAGGQYGSAMVGLAILYNYLAEGIRIIPDTTVPMTRNYISISSVEAYQDYLKYIDGEVPVYNADEIKAMIHLYNPEASFESISAVNAAYSMEDVIARHGEK